jgi:uncharacterized protein
MPNVDAHQPGMFCWVELATLDTVAAKRFYQDLFGWTFEDYPMGEGDPYTILRHNGRDAAALYRMRPEQQAQGVPPNWLLYVSATSADETTQQASALGGTVLGPPFDVFDMGRMSVLQDPAGAVFALWQPQTHKGLGVVNEPGAFCWAELMSKDIAKAKAFYSKLFGWRTEAMPMPDFEYTLFKAGDVSAGGGMAVPAGHDFIPSHWVPYFAVNDCDGTVAKAKGHGSTVHVPPTDIPNIGRFSSMADPQGAAFAILQPAQR